MITRVWVAVTVAFAASGCYFVGPDPEQVSLPLAFGARVTDGELQLWTGAPCPGVTRVTVRFSADAKLVLDPADGKRSELDHLDLDGPYPGWKVAQALPANFDWSTAEQVDLWIDGGEGEGSKRALMADIINGSDQHPADTFWFQDVGWLNPAQVADLDGKIFLTVCTPDPGKP